MKDEGNADWSLAVSDDAKRETLHRWVKWLLERVIVSLEDLQVLNQTFHSSDTSTV